MDARAVADLRQDEETNVFNKY